jgi:Ca2+-transporting ATPase
MLLLALRNFSKIDGTQRAAAFAYYAFFSLFPLIVLFVTIASAFLDRDRAGTEVIDYVKTYVPINGEMQNFIFGAIGGVVKARGKAGVIAFAVLVWSAMQFFSTLINAINRAWDIETHNWWRLPLHSLALLAFMVMAVLVGIALPVMAGMAKHWLFPWNDIRSWVSTMGSFAVLFFVAYLNLGLLYKLAPRRSTRFAEVWAAALCATALLLAAESLFVVYLKSFARFNVVYGAFGGIMALLLWVYLSGCIFIFGACLCAAQAEERLHPVETTMADRTPKPPRTHVTLNKITGRR